ncbi:hypothetical protein NDU88_008771 [Pleurodeles waltl]|uniref:Uncharacterized protein n=1 Tax=Pleurodeles waltl TaxID=8319 RepID=A0AAV7RU76_PLEWA|nr:hypothetical protein NDU88_008771 [Pleurodeles waltl]
MPGVQSDQEDVTPLPEVLARGRLSAAESTALEQPALLRPPLPVPEKAPFLAGEAPSTEGAQAVLSGKSGAGWYNLRSNPNPWQLRTGTDDRRADWQQSSKDAEKAGENAKNQRNRKVQKGSRRSKNRQRERGDTSRSEGTPAEARRY